MLNKEHEELKAKFECIESQSKAPLEQSISLFNFNPKVDSSTSCDDLIALSSLLFCNEICIEIVVIESSNNLVGQENDELKQKWRSLRRT